jgi:hypothetical protein
MIDKQSSIYTVKMNKDKNIREKLVEILPFNSEIRLLKYNLTFIKYLYVFVTLFTLFSCNTEVKTHNKKVIIKNEQKFDDTTNFNEYNNSINNSCNGLSDTTYLVNGNYHLNCSVNSDLCVDIRVENVFVDNLELMNHNQGSKLTLRINYKNSEKIFSDSTHNEDFHFDIPQDSYLKFDINSDSLEDFVFKYNLTGTNASTVYLIIIEKDSVYKSSLSSNEDGLSSSIRESFPQFIKPFPKDFSIEFLKTEYKKTSKIILSRYE